MRIKTDVTGIWSEYEDARRYNQTIDLYNTVQENEDFYIGDQWKGVHAPDLQKPVLNILNRSVAYFVSTLCSDDIGTRLNAYGDDDDSKDLMKIFGEDVDRVIEIDSTKTKLRSVIRNAAVDGDGCLYWYWDADVITGQAATGDVRSEIVENINCLFGNPYCDEVQRQPWIIIALRKPCEEVRDEARRCGSPDWESIHPDGDSEQGEAETANDLTTVLVKMWKTGGAVHAIKTTENAVVRAEWDTMMTMYPVAWMSWQKKRKSYHGQAAVTGLIQNQIAVNKLFAMYIRSVEMNAFPKIVYDRTKFPKGWSNRVGEAIGVVGDVSQAMVNVLRGGDVSPQVMVVIQSCIQMTKDAIGATDAALGNINPTNAAASAIIATQQASSAPLELQRREYYDFVEQCVRIIIDMMGAYYGRRVTSIEREIIDEQTGVQTGTEKEQVIVNYSGLRDVVQQIEVSVGSSAYWTELMQTQTMDNLLKSGVITDVGLYLESVPDKWLPNKQKMIESVKRMQDAQQGVRQQQAAPEQGAPMVSKGQESYFNSQLPM